MESTDLLALTADIVTAHVSHNEVAVSELPMLIISVHMALSKTGTPLPDEAVPQEPAVSIRASVKPDHIVCLEDGRKLTMLKRYLRTTYAMSPEQYRSKWNLPRDYPMVAPDYSEKRRTLAQAFGLGRRKVEETATDAVAPVTGTVIEALDTAVEPIAKAARVGRKKLGIATAKAAAIAHLGDHSPEPDSLPDGTTAKRPPAETVNAE